MTVVSVSMPEDLVGRIDAFATEHGYSGRSEVIREAAESLLGEFDDPALADRELLGVVTVLFDYHSTDIEQDLMALRHEHDDLVASNVHNHVGDRYCMELFILEGTLTELEAFVRAARATGDDLAIEYSLRPVDRTTTRG
ncbi:MAG: CopG family ribbon-helix-helix protein [Salinirussus sp.]